MNIRKTILFFIVLSIFTLVGCSVENSSKTYINEYSTSTDNEDKNNYESDNNNNVLALEQSPTTGGELILSMRSPKTLNPLINQDVTVDEVLKLIFEPLFKIDEQTMKPVPNIASDYTISADGRSISISIKDGLYWHDGTKITAKDVVFSLSTIEQNPTSIYYYALNKVSSYRASNNQVIINYTEPNGFALFSLCFPIIPSHYYNGNLDVSSSASFEPLGSGSFKFKNYRLANELVLESTSSFKGTPYISTVKAIITPDFETDVYAFENNVINSTYADFSVWGNLITNRQKLITQTFTNNFEFLGFNFENSDFSDKQLRKAIAYAIPKDEIINNIYLSSGIKSVSPINPQSYLYTPLTDTYQYNIMASLNALSLSNVSTTTFTLLVNSENSERLETANLIQKSLEQIGIEIIIIPKSFDQYKIDLENGNFELFLGGIDFDVVPNYYSFLSSSGLGLGGINYQNYSSQYMDTLINNMYNATSELNFMSACTDFQLYFSEELPVVGIMFKNGFLLTDTTVIGNKSPTLLNPFNNIEEWYMDNSHLE